MKLVIILFTATIVALVVLLSCGGGSDSPSGPTTPSDTTRPYIIGIVPDSNNFNVSPTDYIMIRASEKLNPATVTTTSVTFYGGNPPGVVAATLTCTDSIITITPSAPLQNDGLYQVEATLDVEDKAGNALQSYLRFDFGVEPYTTSAVNTWVRRLKPNAMSDEISLNSVVARQDGNFALCGSLSDIWLAEISASGGVNWLSNYYASGNSLRATDLIERSDGFLIDCGNDAVTARGFVHGTTQLGSPAISYTYYLGQSWAYLYSIIETSGYNTVACGESNHRAYLIRTSAFGGSVWQRYLGANGASYFYKAKGVAKTGTGYVVCGTVSLQGNPPIDGCVIQTNDTGIAVWEQTFGAADFASIVDAGNGTFTIVGSTPDGHIIVVNINGTGAEQWRTDVGLGKGYAIEALFDHGCVITGEHSGKVVLAKLTSSGALTWRRDLIDGPGRSVAVAGDGGFIVAVGPRIFTTDRSYLLKTDANGNL